MARIVQYVLTWFRYYLLVIPPETQPTPLEHRSSPIPEAVEPQPEKRTIVRSIAVTEGEFYFRDAILDQLDVYFGILGRMKKADPDAFDLYSRIGINLVPRKDRIHEAWEMQASTWWRTNRPSIGGVAFGDLYNLTKYETDHGHCYVPKFLYFTRYAKKFPPPEFERPGLKGDVYQITVYWDDAEKDAGIPWSYGVVLGDNGMVQVLKTKSCRSRRVRSTVSNKRLGFARGGPRTLEVPMVAFEHHPAFCSWAGEHNTPVAEFLAGIFIEALNTYERSNYSMIRVDVEKGGRHAAFGVNIIRTPYFFKDRDDVIDEDGVKKRIFHIVRGHVRVNGARVKTHFRGLREFTWNGYSLKITVPVRDHAPLDEYDVPAVDGEAYTENDRLVPQRAIGMGLRNMLDDKLKFQTGTHARH